MLSRTGLLKFYVSALAFGALGALVLTGWGIEWDGSATFLNGLIAIFAVALAAQLSSVSVNVGSARMSIAFIPLLAATFLFAPFWAMLLGGLTFLVVEAFVLQKPLIKIIFNAAKEVLALGLAASVFHALGGRPSVAEQTFLVWPAILGASVAYTAANSTSVSLAVGLSEDMPFGQVWSRMYGGTVLYDVFAAPVPALLAYLYVWQELLGVVALAVPLFVVRHVYIMNLRLEQSNRDLLDLMVKAIEARDPYTSGHSQRVAQYARVLAKEAGISWKHVEQIATAALLHDVGKIYEEYAPLLRKEGKLTSDEKKLLQSHPVRSAELVSTISSLRGPVAEAVRHHHEHYDGSGYPDGFVGERIPIGARVIMIADTLDAMTTDRPYRKALSFDRVVEEVVRHSGRQFDPRLADLALKSHAIRRLVSAVATTSLEAPSLVLAMEKQISRRSERAGV